MNKQLTATGSLATALAHIPVAANVGMGEIVDVFMAKYEQDLTNKRKSLQDQVKGLNDKIKALHDKVLAAGEQLVRASLVAGKTANSFVKQETTVEEFSVDWAKKAVQFKYGVSIKAVTESTHWNRSSSSTIYCGQPINQVDLDTYSSLMSEKAELMTKLGDVNNDIKQISSKERLVRGTIAAKKLEEAGMGDLLNNDELLQLIKVD